MAAVGACCHLDGLLMTIAFHARDGFYFRRLPGGRVKVYVNGGSYECHTVLDPLVWAKVVASVSEAGESSKEVFQEALRLHQGSIHTLPYRQAVDYWENLDP